MPHFRSEVLFIPGIQSEHSSSSGSAKARCKMKQETIHRGHACKRYSGSFLNQSLEGSFQSKHP